MNAQHNPATASITARILAAIASVCTTLTLLQATFFIAAHETAKPVDKGTQLALASTKATPVVAR